MAKITTRRMETNAGIPLVLREGGDRYFFYWEKNITTIFEGQEKKTKQTPINQ